MKTILYVKQRYHYFLQFLVKPPWSHIKMSTVISDHILLPYHILLLSKLIIRTTQRLKDDSHRVVYDSSIQRPYEIHSEPK